MKLMLMAVPTLTVVLAAPVLAQPVVDGSITGDGYGAAVSVQAVETAFGDNLSELNAAYCTTHDGRLYIALTGNIEANFNALEIFVDSKAGGENALSGLPGNNGTGVMAGFSFDPGFAADYQIFARRGPAAVDHFDVDFSELGTVNFSSYVDVFGGTLEGSGVTGTGLNTLPMGIGYDNSNVAGVSGGTGAANQAAALAVQTGFEMSIALADLGYSGGDIKVCAFVNTANHDFASNQFLGPLQPPQGNLGGDGSGNFTGTLVFGLASFAGEQHFTCIDGTTPVEDATWSRLKALYR